MVQYCPFRKEGISLFQRIRKLFSREMIRPLIYKFFTRGILALFAAQLVHFFAPTDSGFASFSNLSLGLGFLFLLFSFLAWLRLDGLKIPMLKLPRMKRKDPPFLAGNMADHMDDEIVSFDDLDPDEQNICVLLADILLAVLCMLLSAVV